MLKKILIICLAYLVIALAFSCYPCKCNDKPRIFDYISFWQDNILYEFPTDTTYNTIHSDADSIPLNAYGISLNYTSGFVFNPVEKNNGFSLMNTAYACKCVVQFPKPNDPIASLAIYTLNDFDDAHLSGSDVTEYFVYLFYEHNTLRYNKKSIYEIRDFFEGISGTVPVSIATYLDKNPTLNNTVAFEVIVTLVSGKKFTNRTPPVTLY